MINFERMINTLHDHGVEFIIIGGCAATVHGVTLVTQDLDLCIPFTKENMHNLLESLKGLNPIYRHNEKPIESDPAVLAGYKNLYLLTDVGSVDLLGELPKIGNYETLLKHTIEIDLFGNPCRVLNIDTLIKAKRAMDRPKDKETIVQLNAIKKTF